MARRERGEVRTAILDTAAELLRTHGDVDKVSIDAVVKAVGCTPPTLYYYFPTKTDLLMEVCLREYARFAADLQAATTTGEGDAMAALHRRGLAYLAWAREHPAHYRLLFMTHLDLPGEEPPMTAAGLPDFSQVPGLGDLVRDLERLREQGYAVADPNLDAFALWGVVHGAAALAITEPQLPTELFAWSINRTARAMFVPDAPAPDAPTLRPPEETDLPH